jgi:hypothetical protein
MDLPTLIGLGIFTWGSASILYWQGRRIYDNVEDYREQGEHKDALSKLKEESVTDTIDRATKAYQNDAVLEQYALVKAKTARGHSIALYNHKKGLLDSESLAKVVKAQRKKIKDLEEKSFKYQSVFVKNFYNAPSLLFWHHQVH